MHSIGGYRLLRLVGAGSRAEVYLAHPDREGADLPPAVVKVYGQAVIESSIIAEAEALSRAAGDHVVRALDVTATPEGATALILSRHAAGSLARLLADRPALEAGEAITILAPLARALARVHDAGVGHGAISPGSVLFDAAGSPAWACFGRSSLFSAALPVARLESEQAVLADVLAFGELAGVVLDRAGAAALARRVRTEAAPGAWLSAFADSLFDLGEPLPVNLRPRAGLAAAQYPSRLVEPRDPLPPDPASEPVRRPPLLAALPFFGRAVDDSAVQRSSDSPARSRDVWRQIVSRFGLEKVLVSVKRVRPLVWVVAGASVTALVAAVVLSTGPEGSGDPEQRSALSDTEPLRPGSGPVTEDDPVAAAVLLLETRERCIRDLSESCLDDVAQRGSSALRADRAIVESILDGGESGPMPDPEGATLTQRLGDSALIALGPNSEPASVLLVKGEAGWRIRDYLEE